MGRIWIIGGVSIVACLAAIFIWRAWPPEEEVVKPLQVATFDDLMKEFARRVGGGTGKAPDFQVLVTESVEPIGTLFEPGRTVAANDEACVPLKEPTKRDTPNLFPAIETRRSVAGDFGLEAPLSHVARAKATTAETDSVTLQVDAPGRIVLTGDKLAEVLNGEACRKAIGDRKMLIVRGYISGKRRAVLARDSSVKVEGVTQFASFVIAPDGAGRVSLTDSEERRFLQIVSEVAIAPPAPTPPPPPSPAPSPAPSPLPKPPPPAAKPSLVAAPIKVMVPVAPKQEGRIYIQRDIADQSGRAVLVKQALKSVKRDGRAAYDVVEGIDRIASTKVPRTPQVRYFRDQDRDWALEVAGVLKSAGVNAEVSRVGLRAPPKQLEVWLERVGS